MSQQSFHQQTATGADINFTITTFSSDEIKVYVDGVLKSAGSDYNINPYNTSGQSTVDWIGTAPTSPSVVRIIRQTDIMNNGNTAVEGRATFQAGSSVKADDLNNNQKQVLRALQERQDQKIQRYDLEDNEVIRSKIAADAVDGTKIADDSINSEHYVADSIDTEHYAPNSVDATAIGSNAVTTVKILDDNVTMDKLGSGALPTDITVNTDNIVNGSITTADIGADQITSALIADDQIDSEHYVDGSVDRQHLEADIIDSTKLADNAVNSEHYVDGSIDRVHLSNDIIDSTKIQDDAVRSEHIQANAVTDSEIATGTLDNRYYTETELDAGQLDNRYYTETEAEAKFLRQDSSETIASGVTWSSSDAFVATTAAIDLRVIELVDDVGGFVPIANETSFPTSNPDINNPATGGTIVSVKAASTDLAPSGTTVTIANGRGSGLAVVITGVTATIPSGFGFLVETTSTDHTYAFHRLVPVATQVATVANNITNIVNAGANVADINNFADLYQISQNAPTARGDNSSLQVGDLWFDSSSNKVLMIYDGSSGDGFSPATPNQSDLTNINIVAGHITFQEDLGLITNAINTGSGNNSVNTVGSNIANVNTAATNIAKITTVADDLNESTSEIDTVATNITNVNNVGNNISNVNTVASNNANVTAVAGNATNINTVAANNANVTTVAGNISDVNNFADLYQIANSNPSHDGGGNNLAQGDLYFNTATNELRVYNGGSWQGGVTATGNLAGLGANTFTGNQTINANIIISGTVDGKDVSTLIANVVEDTSPQLGGALDGQDNNMSNIGTIDGTNLQLDFGTL